MRGAVMTLAQQRAEKIVKQEIRDKGIRKVSQVKRSEIMAMGSAYLAAHPELIAEAKPVIAQWITEGVFGKRAQRAAEHISQQKLNSKAAVPQAVALNECLAHNDGATQ
jgi:hypothetical protein